MLESNPASPFQFLYIHIKKTDPNLFQALDRIFSIYQDLQTQLEDTQKDADKKVNIADSGLAWVGNTLYDVNAIVTYSGHVYLRKISGRSFVTPDLESHAWTLVI